MSDIFQESLRRALDLAASDAPAPGGGSVSALAACFGLSMTAMVGNLTVGKKKYLAVEAEVKELLVEVKKLSEQMEGLVQEDMDVFNRFMFALGLPKNTAEEQGRRSIAMEEALRFATETPLEIARVCLSGLSLTLGMAKIGNQTAISDAGVAALILEASLNGALLNVEANINMLKDQTYAVKAKEESGTLSVKGLELKEEILRVVRQKIADGK
ncbi:MAG: cyclodeaminase/cyclohydrolase family protein [Peptococcaceae bacterium]|nr:cyclodeaminase/cyclohydrolase family protein [Peptococcaceae bacterium]